MKKRLFTPITCPAGLSPDILRALVGLLLIGGSRALVGESEGRIVLLGTLLLAAGYLCWRLARAFWRARQEKPQADPGQASKPRQGERPCSPARG
jgi:hypothetical protein